MASKSPNFVLVGTSSTKTGKSSSRKLAAKFNPRRKGLLVKVLAKNARKAMKFSPKIIFMPRSSIPLCKHQTPLIPIQPKEEPSYSSPVTRNDVLRPEYREGKQPVKAVDLNEETLPADNDVVVFSIILRSHTPGDVGVMYDIRSDETFHAIFDDYAAKIDVEPHRIRVYKGSNQVHSDQRPSEVGVESGDMLFVVGLPGVINCNTRIKSFFIKNTGHRHKVKLQVHSKLDTPMCRLFHIWAKEIKGDPTNLLMMHEDKVVTTVDTVRDVGIKNDDKVVVLPNYF